MQFASSNHRLFFKIVVVVGCLASCAADPPSDEGGGGAGGLAAGEGGSVGEGGASSGVGGSPALGTGGTSAASGGMGGSVGQGGSPAQGGAPGTGGMISTGPLDGITAPAGSPVADWGRLKVCGTKICSQRGNAVQLKGISSMWLNWENSGYAKNADALKWMRDNWKVKVIRASMGIEPAGAYLSNEGKARADVQAVIDAAISVGLYVIVDWHDHAAQDHKQQALSFFSDMAAKYGNQPNVLWETFNEPLKVDWTSVLKPYHEAVVGAIRAKDPDNLIILGTPQWSQRVDQAASNPVAGTNLLYTLHFYSCSHGAEVRTYGEAAISRGVAVFVTEWGATHADGGLDGRTCLPEAQTWHDWMNNAGVSWTAWKLDDCEPDASCLLRPGAPANGGWGDNWLRGHASFVRDRMK
ncbi:MAG: glycoside hydrolase family 5 protein [Deltaproteobacteria bacterium]|nr:glycoside hydrolase family 5 protein [Deltaproteobacteria bacterium]